MLLRYRLSSCVWHGKTYDHTKKIGDNISEKLQDTDWHSYNGRLIGNHIWPTKWNEYQCPWMRGPSATPELPVIERRHTHTDRKSQMPLITLSAGVSNWPVRRCLYARSRSVFDREQDQCQWHHRRCEDQQSFYTQHIINQHNDILSNCF